MYAKNAISWFLNLFRKNRWYELIFIVLLGLILGLLFVWPLQSTGNVFSGDDFYYQVARIQSITNGVNNGHFLFQGLTNANFYNIGFGLNLFYPWMTLLPFAIIASITGNIGIGIYGGLAFFSALGFVLFYYAARLFYDNRLFALFSSITFLFSSYRTIDGVTRFALGEFIGMTFLPIVMIGLYEILFGNKKFWPLFSIGLAFTLMSHVLTSFLIVVFSSLCWLFTVPAISEKLKRTLSLLKAGILGALGAGIFIFPFLEQELSNKFLQPSRTTLKGLQPSALLLDSMDNNIQKSVDGNQYNVGIVIFVVLIIGVFLYTKLPKKFKAMEFMGIFTLIVSTGLMPWFLLEKTPMSLIQFPARLLMFPTLFGSIVAGKIVVIIFSNIKKDMHVHQKYALVGMLTTVIILIVFPWSGSINNFIFSPGLANGGAMPMNREIRLEPITTGQMYVEQYVPKESQKYLADIEKHVAIINHSASVTSPVVSWNTLSFDKLNLKGSSVVDLPVIAYRNMVVNIDGKTIKTNKSKRGTILFTSPRTKVNKVIVFYKPSLIDRLGIVITLLFISFSLIWLVNGFRKGIRKKMV